MLASLTSCSKDDDPNNIYQEYYVRISVANGVTMKSAHANFRIGGDQGARVILSGGASVSCNTHTMVGSMNDNDAYYYGCEIERNHKKANFQLALSRDKVLNNTIDFANVPEFNFTDLLSSIPEDGLVQLDLNGAKVSELKAYAEPLGSFTNPDGTTSRINLTISPEGAVSTSMLPNGDSNLVVEYTTSQPTQENDGNGGGIMKLTREISKKISKR